jgi:hypothetical protein
MGGNKTAKDRYEEHIYSISSPEIVDQKQGTMQPLISIYYSENDGENYNRSGAERKIVIDIDKSVTINDIQHLLSFPLFIDEVKTKLEEMVRSNNIVRHISFRD